MILSIKMKKDKLDNTDLQSILFREWIYKTPFEIHISYKVEPHQQFDDKIGDKCKITLNNGYEIEMTILKLIHNRELNKIIFCQNDMFDVMTNNLNNGDTVSDTKLVNYVSKDSNCYLNFREELARKGLVSVIDEDLVTLKNVHVTSWQGKTKKRLYGFFRRVNINLKNNYSRYVENKNGNTNDKVGYARNIHSYYLEQSEIDALNQRIEPKVNVICTGLNSHIQIMDKVLFAETEYCVMGIQRTTKNRNDVSLFTLGLLCTS